MTDGQDPIYLDHNGTTPLLPDVVEAMLPYLREHFGNPSSGHVYGVRAHKAVERARAQVAALLDCDPGEVIFTSGGTEASNLAIHGVLERCFVERSESPRHRDFGHRAPGNRKALRLAGAARTSRSTIGRRRVRPHARSRRRNP